MTALTVQDKQHCTVTWLLTPWLSLSSEQVISGMNLDSRQINSGDLFVALQGALSDGRAFIDAAISAGASAVLAETTDSNLHGQTELRGQVLVVHFYQLAQQLSAIALRFYFPTQVIHKLTGVTGTNGKTTIATLLANCYQVLGEQSAQMGTIGNGLYGQLKASLNTTLDAISVCRELADYQAQGAKHTIMEVSSHGLIQGRISAVPFATAIFTNLTRDHLDYHGTMQAYADAKKMLFDNFPLKNKVINADDEVGKRWLTEHLDAIAYGFKADDFSESHRYLLIKKVNYTAQGIQFDFQSSWGAGRIRAPFYGDFNVLNIAAVCCALLAEDYPLEQVMQTIEQLEGVAGRMEQYFFPKQQVTFVVDYAHTPDALSSALTALQCHKQQGRIIAMFGCGGDRDKGKRPEMAKAAELGADQVMIVDDNPRSEDPTRIVKDIQAGLMKPEQALIVHDRKQAILTLLAQAQAHDIILVAGKGHEDYQIIGDKKIDYSDRVCLAELLALGDAELDQLMQEIKS